MDVLDDVDYNMPCVCENVSMSVNPHDYDDMLHESMGVVKIPNVKLLKKKAKKFHENLSKFICEKDDLIAKLNESNKLVEKYKKFAEHSLEKLKEFKCLNVDLDAELVLSNKLFDDLKCENESLKMHDNCLIAELIAKKEENLCCNHVVLPDFVPIVSSISKDKSVYIPPHKRNQKVERKALKPKPPFRSHPRDLRGLESFASHLRVVRDLAVSREAKKCIFVIFGHQTESFTSGSRVRYSRNSQISYFVGIS
ncbi:hypothetical protein SO802_012541 [Lithocarpus litseifolius]|uniref:Uncharacterized protein n=1 Tax=Lithocarpus litseifolius TaxID=425828 RepID=A0AAW2D323_9ROSI